MQDVRGGRKATWRSRLGRGRVMMSINTIPVRASQYL